MGKIFEWDYKVLVFIFICSISNLLIITSNHEDVYLILAQNNFITLIPDTLIIFLIGRRVYLNNRIKNFIITRIGLREFLLEQFVNGVMYLSIYLLLQYSFNFLVLNVNPKRINVIILYLFFNLFVLIVQVIILNLINFETDVVVITITIIIIKFFVHYVIVQNIISSLYIKDFFEKVG